MKNEDLIGLQQKFAAFMNQYKDYDFHQVECAERNLGTQVVFTVILNVKRPEKSTSCESSS